MKCVVKCAVNTHMHAPVGVNDSDEDDDVLEAETCYVCQCRGKRDPLYRQKRPTIEAKETYYRGKRDLLQRQKRPTIEAKETYYRGKRDLVY